MSAEIIDINDGRRIDSIDPHGESIKEITETLKRSRIGDVLEVLEMVRKFTPAIPFDGSK